MSNDKKHVYGIDLGTTYSAIAFINEFGKAEVIKNSEGDSITPSVVFFENESNITVGKTAKDAGSQSKEDASRVVDFVKRQMSNTTYKFEAFGKEYGPIEVSSMILKRIVNDAKESGGHDVQNVVITCPAYFGELERTRTRQAGELIGLNVIEILDEPVAAALNYSLEDPNTKGKNVIVYDLGGGTFDVTVISIGNDPNKDEVKVVCTEGDHQLGGKDWDDKIVDFYLNKFEETTGLDIRSADPEETFELLFNLRLTAEKNKKTLTSRDKVAQKVSYGGKEEKIEMTRQQFDEMTAELLDRTFILTDRLLTTAKEKGVSKIDAFLLVGGSTRMTQIAAKVTEKYGASLGITPVSFDPDESVAKGAAKEGQIFAIKTLADEGKSDHEIALETGVSLDSVTQAKKTVVAKVATKTYGTRLHRSASDATGYVHNLIFKQTEVPYQTAMATYPLSTTNSLSMALYASDDEGNKETALDRASLVVEKNWELGRTVSPSDEITNFFAVSAEGKITLKCSIAGAVPFELEFTPEGALNNDEFDEAKAHLAMMTTA
ncbi:molecular chaperone DnaK [Planctomycetales bacterium]|nr:molecular chaperone DnaK [Planctomycetales bacterium]